jgi:hypothetical protein
MIYFKCSACGGEHPSRMVQMDKAGFERAIFQNNTETCPATGRPVSYSKDRMLWKEPPGAPPPKR